MRTTFYVIMLLVRSYTAASAAVAAPSQFDGVWERQWSSTSPRGVHQDGRWTVTIRTGGISSELFAQTLTQTISGVTKTLRTVQSCKATKNLIKGSTLTIMWSESKLLSPKPSDIPSGLHLWTAPITRTYTIRGKEDLTRRCSQRRCPLRCFSLCHILLF
jgi:hypothetical protein